VAKKDEEQLLKFFNIIQTYEMENIHDTTPIEEIVYFIEHKEQFGIKEDTKLAILSLNTRRTIKKSLELTGIEKYFDIIIGREDVRSWKPSPEGLIKIKNYFGVAERDMVYFGDLENDIKTGKNAGIDAYYIDLLIAEVKKSMPNL
jgi:HAD superfamily hydrolase (TIGR01549 family)